MKIFKAASKYHNMTVSEGTAYLLHGSVVRVSKLFGTELDLMIQFAVAHLTAASEQESAESCKFLFQDIICNDSTMEESQ